MEIFKRTFPALLLLFLLLLLSSEVNGSPGSGAAGAVRPPVEREEKRTCESQSHRFKGLCFSKSNCGHVCRTEGFEFGQCRGLRSRCFCTKHC
ncbi:Defensin J1-2 [Apostasia shenzhenica]|uniref:Defensin J1-2 n=1 Tax=Apostasia shenzhenica TaxID=1088818 RepID=A0A2I0A9B1_9ASPA|nr:Defensin J1-2 [Apostasia shenzhenica]